MLAAKQLSSACLYAESIDKRLPCRALSRPFPKGALGIQRTKDLHDDGNSAIIPGIWTSLRGDPNVVLRFVAKSFNVYFRTSDLRFCWFMGWIPHKTEVLLNPNYRSLGPMIKVERIHHSAFSKPDLEHLSLSVFDPSCMRTVVDSYKLID